MTCHDAWEGLEYRIVIDLHGSTYYTWPLPAATWASILKFIILYAQHNSGSSTQFHVYILQVYVQDVQCTCMVMVILILSRRTGLYSSWSYLGMPLHKKNKIRRRRTTTKRKDGRIFAGLLKEWIFCILCLKELYDVEWTKSKGSSIKMYYV